MFCSRFSKSNVSILIKKQAQLTSYFIEGENEK
jgi:hypothetical protein